MNSIEIELSILSSFFKQNCKAVYEVNTDYVQKIEQKGFMFQEKIRKINFLDSKNRNKVGEPKSFHVLEKVDERYIIS